MERATAVVILAIVGTVLIRSRGELRSQTRLHMASRDAESLYAVLQSQQLSEITDMEGLGGGLEDVGTQFDLLLKTSRIRGVIAGRLFDRDGRFVAASPENVIPETLDGPSIKAVQALKPRSQFIPHADLSAIFWDATRKSESREGVLSPPLVAVTLPIHHSGKTNLLGIAEFLIDGANLQSDYDELDQTLRRESVLTLATAGGLVLAVLMAAFNRLSRANRILHDRTQLLLRANHELTLTSKTSALGGVAAHLIHGIKNPILGMRALVRQGTREPESISKEDWKDLAETSGRVEQSIQEVLRMMSEECSPALYEVSIEEVIALVCTSTEPLLRLNKVELTTHIITKANLGNRDANLTILILQNLVANAVEATRSGGRVRLSVTRHENRLAFEVQDTGSGIPEEKQQRLFEAGITTKRGGTGLGLAISKQLANSMGATLELASSSLSGSRFKLVVMLKTG